MLKEGIHYEFFVSDKGGAALDRITGKIKNMEGAVKKLDHEHGVGFDNMTKKTNKLKAGIGELAREFPLLGQAIRLATSPLVFVINQRYILKANHNAIHVWDTFKILKIASIYSKTTASIYTQWIKDGDLIYGNKKSELFNWITVPMTASSKSPLKGKDKKKSGFNGSIDGIDFTDFPLQNQTNNFNKDTKKSLSGSSAMLPPLFHRLGEIGVRQ